MPPSTPTFAVALSPWTSTAGPLCPQCGERDRVQLPGDPCPPQQRVNEGAWCNRCNHWLSMLQPRTPVNMCLIFEGGVRCLSCCESL